LNEPKVLLIGASGRLGSTIAGRLAGKWNIVTVTGAGSGDRRFDIRKREDRRKIPDTDFDMVVNAAAMSSRSECSRKPREAFTVNTLWPALLAVECGKRKVPLLHFSTDLVYSGGNPPYNEGSPAVPLSFYGWTKLLADRFVTRLHPGALVVRTSVLCGEVSSPKTTFSQDILSGKVKKVWVDSWRNHTPISWLVDLLPDLLSRGITGLVTASGRYARTRAAYAEALLRVRGLSPDHLEPEYSPAGVPGMLDLICSYGADRDVV